MCAIYGILDYGKRLSPFWRQHLLRKLGKACEERGTDASGIAYFDRGQLTVTKAAVPARRLRFFVPQNARFMMGHTRMTTQGDEKHNYNNHPFQGKVRATPFALAHNGIIHNDKELRKEFGLPKTTIETDSYVAVQLLEKSGAVTFETLAQTAELLRGSFTLTVLTPSAFYAVRGNNPLCVYHFSTLGIYLYASTEPLLWATIEQTTLALEPCETLKITEGDILRIDLDGKAEVVKFDASALFGRFEWLYDFPQRSTDTHEYIQTLRTFALREGIPEREFDELLADGFTPDELEEFIFCGEVWR